MHLHTHAADTAHVAHVAHATHHPYHTPTLSPSLTLSPFTNPLPFTTLSASLTHVPFFVWQQNLQRLAGKVASGGKDAGYAQKDDGTKNRFEP